MSSHRNACDCVPIKLYLWAPKFSFHIIFPCHENSISLDYFQLHIKIIFSSQAKQKQVAGGIWPSGHSSPTPNTLSTRHLISPGKYKLFLLFFFLLQIPIANQKRRTYTSYSSRGLFVWTSSNYQPHPPSVSIEVLFLIDSAGLTISSHLPGTFSVCMFSLSDA